MLDNIDNEDPNDRFMVEEAENVTEKKGWYFSFLVYKNKYKVFRIYQTDIRKNPLTMCSIYSVILLPLKFWIYYNYIVNTFLTILLRNSLNTSYFV